MFSKLSVNLPRCSNSPSWSVDAERFLNYSNGIRFLSNLISTPIARRMNIGIRRTYSKVFETFESITQTHSEVGSKECVRKCWEAFENIRKYLEVLDNILEVLDNVLDVIFKSDPTISRWHRFQRVSTRIALDATAANGRAHGAVLKQEHSCNEKVENKKQREIFDNWLSLNRVGDNSSAALILPGELAGGTGWWNWLEELAERTSWRNCLAN